MRRDDLFDPHDLLNARKGCDLSAGGTRQFEWQTLERGFVLEPFNVPNPDSAHRATGVNEGSGQRLLPKGIDDRGERGRLHLAKTLIAGGNVLLLDEPSNDLDVETLRALEDALLEFAGCVLVISHDRWFLDRIATHILAAEGDSQWTFFAGNYQEYEADKRKRLGDEGAKPKRLRYKPISR